MPPVKTFGERIADALIEDGLLLAKCLPELIEQQKREGVRLLRLIVDQRLVSEDDLAVAMGRVLNTPPVNLRRMGIPSEIMELVPREVCLNHNVIPVSRLENKLFLAMADPLNVLAIDDIRRITRMEVSPMIAPEKAILDKLHQLDTAKAGTMEDIIQDALSADLSVSDDDLCVEGFAAGGPLGPGTSSTAATPSPLASGLPRDENVQFTVFRPQIVTPTKWYPLLAFAHTTEKRLNASPDEPHPLEEVERQARQELDARWDEYRAVSQDSSTSVPAAGEITFLPEVAGVEFNPTRATFRWIESVHRQNFRIRVAPECDGQTVRGRLTVLLGSRIIADVSLAIRVDSRETNAPAVMPPDRVSARPYRKVFASYAHSDLPIVQEFEQYAVSLGDRYLCDSVSLRAGEVWNDRLAEMIREADVFQLFWSNNSMRSGFVQCEWEHALSLSRPHFVRPVYWEEPLPEDKTRGLPPAPLARLHFQRIIRQMTPMPEPSMVRAEPSFENPMKKNLGKSGSRDDFIQDSRPATADTDNDDVESVKETVEKVNLDQLAAISEEAPVIKLANLILVQAIKDRATDIHIEPFEKMVRLRYRIDGILIDKVPPPKNIQISLMSRLKIMSCLDIAERRLPQDGRMRVKVGGRDIDLRVTFAPTLHGEKCVLRVLERSNLLGGLEKIGMDADALSRIRAAVRAPQGLLLVTGPTGAGKTTTLYALLHELNQPEYNVVTVEDPIECGIPGINQIAVKKEIGLSCAAALRAVLRLDPDIIMIGEIRDSETAEIAVEAAVTGHQVLSTMHCPDAVSAVTRLDDMSVPPFLISSSVVLSCSQRLMRRVCPHCREPVSYPPAANRGANLPSNFFEGATLFRGRGCERCNGTGYLGRTAVVEAMCVTDEIRALILARGGAGEIAKVAVAQGMRLMWEVALSRVREGVTTLEQALVTFPISTR